MLAYKFHVDNNFSKGSKLVAIIKDRFGSIRNCGVVLKIERFSHLSDQSFGFDFLVGLGTYN